MHDFDLKKSQILDRTDVLEVIREHVALKRTGRRWVGLCPFHAEKTPSFTVNPDLGIFKCFGCGRAGDVFSFVQAKENVSFREALQILADRAGVELERTRASTADGPSRTDVARANEWALRFFQSNLREPSAGRFARDYLASRGFTQETIDRFELGLAVEILEPLLQAASRAGISLALLRAADLVRPSDRGGDYATFRNRLMFPIRDAMQRPVGFGGRTLGDDKAKYLNTQQTILFDKGRGLYGLPLARERILQTRRAIVVEGYTDCLAAHQAGVLDTVATLGTALTEAQVDLLRRYCDEIVLLFDSDDAGSAAADRAIRVALPRCVTVRLARVPEGKDPCEFLVLAGADAFSDVLKGAVEALEFKWSQTLRLLGGAASPAARRSAMLGFVELIAEGCAAGAVDEIQRGLLANQVAHVLQMDSAEVHRLMVRMSHRTRPKATAGPQNTVPRSSSEPADSSAQAAWTRLLEVALVEPGLLQGLAAEEGLSLQEIQDPHERRIAEMVFDLAERVGEFRLADVLARCHDPLDAQRVVDLAGRGRSRPNHEASFRLAVERIQAASQTQEVERDKRRLSVTQATDHETEGAADALTSIYQRLRTRRHFAPRRLIATEGPMPPPSPSAPRAVERS